MNENTSRYVKGGIIALALIALGVNASLLLQPFQPASAARGSHGAKHNGPPPVLKTDNGDGRIQPERTIEQMRKLNEQFAIYRNRHNGAYPPVEGPASLDKDTTDNPAAYGFSDKMEAARFIHNPDMKYADDARDSGMAEFYNPYRRSASRPDGSAVGSDKPAGTRDVLAYTDMYYHRNIVNYKEGKPSGFYLVLWEDGQVEKVPFEQARYLGPQLGYHTNVVFPGQAGLPATGVHTYAEYKKWLHDHL